MTMTELINELLKIMTSMGYWGIMLGLMIEIIPSEIVLAYGGLLVYRGNVSFTEAVIFGTIGGTIAQIFVYWIGRYGGRPFLEKYGKYLLIHDKHIDMAEAWFNRYGTGVIFTARFIPVVRHAISIPAGMAKMPLGRFTLYTAMAVIPWSILFVFLGFKLGQLGKSFEQIGDIAGPYVQPFIWVSVALTLLYIVIKIVRRRKQVFVTEQGNTAETSMTGEQEMDKNGKRLLELGSGYIVLHSQRVAAGGSSQVIEHLAIGPNGVFHIRTEGSAGIIRLTTEGIQRGEEKGYEDVTGPLYRNEYVVKQKLRSKRLEADVVGLLCFVHPDCRLEGRMPAFAAVRADQLVEVIQSYKPKKLLSVAEVKEIASLMEAGSGRNTG